MILRPLRPADVDAVVAIEASSAIHPWGPSAFERELSEPQARWLVAEQDQAILGFGGVRCLGEEAQVYELAVSPGARQHGVGRAMLAALIAAAEHAGCQRMTLEVASDNHAAIHLYTTFGFRPVSRRRGFYTPTQDALLMERP